MIWFQRLFPVVMLLWPVLCLQWLLPRGTDEEERRSRKGRLAAMWAATLVLLLAHMGIQLWLEGARVPGAQIRLAYPILAAVLGSLALWFGLGMRTLIEARPALAQGSRGPGGEVRAASLVPRHRSNPVPRAAWVAGWTIFALCVLVMVLAILRGAPVGLLAGTAFWLFSGPLAARLSLSEPEPFDAAGSPELIEAYESLRHFKVWLFFWMGLTGTVLFTGVTVAVALNPQAGGWAGAIFGVALGLAGGLLGLIGGLRRARVNELRQRLTAAPNGSERD